MGAKFRKVAGMVATSSLVVAGMLVGVSDGQVHATSVTVTAFGDGVFAGSLRWAIGQANADPAIDLILVPAIVTYQLDECGNFENDNATGDLDITRSATLTIRGTGGGRAVIEQKCLPEAVDRIIDHRGSGTLILENLSIQDGALPTRSIVSATPFAEYHGGGIRSAGGDLVLDDTELSDNQAGDGGDGNAGFANANPGARGGGIYSVGGAITIRDSWVFGNRPGNGGDGDGAGAADPAGGGSGGAIYSEAGAISVTRSLIEDNQAGIGGVGTGSDTGGSGGVGGAIYADGPGSVSIVDSTIENNRGGAGGGSATGNGGAGGFAGAINSNVNVTVTVDGSSFVNNRGGGGGNGGARGGAGGAGGGILTPNAIVTGSEFLQNLGGTGGSGNSNLGGAGGDGGAIVAQQATLTTTSFEGNRAGGGGTSNSPGGPGGDGGAVAVTTSLTAIGVAALDNQAGSGGFGSSGGLGGNGGGFATFGVATPVMTVSSSSFHGNIAGAGGGPLGIGPFGIAGDGGAIHNYANAAQSTLVTNSSFFENRAGPSGGAGAAGQGAALAVNNLTMRYSTVVGNLASVAITKAQTGLAGFDRITASVIGDNVGGNCSIVTQSGGHNYEVGGDSCSFAAATDRVNQSALGLDPITADGDRAIRLATIGGPLDASIPTASCSSGFLAGITTDQRGVTRPQGLGCEPGAAEVGSVPLDPELDAATRFVPLSPVRLFDTRPSEPAPGPKGFVAANGTIDVQIGGVGGVPQGAVAVVINVTATATEGPSFVTVYPTGQARPLASSINITLPDQTRPNLVTVPIGAGGKLSLYTKTGAHLLGDVAGYYQDVDASSRRGRFVPLTPQRLFDTRPGEPAPGFKGKLAAKQAIEVQVSGVGDVPLSGVDAIVINLTGTEASAAGFVTAYPFGISLPLASNVNLDGPGATAPNLAIVPLGPGGKIRVYSSHGAHVLGDVTGYITDGSAALSTVGLFVPLTPERVFDTRPAQPAPGPKGYLAAGARIDAQVAGTGNVPSDAGGVVLNATAIAGPLGFVTAWETGPSRPLASTINLAAPLDTRANGAMLPIGAGGKISFFSKSGSDLLADTSGFFLG
jgi:hypothetical protein